MVAAMMRGGTVTTRSALFQDTFDRSNATNYDALPGGGFVMLRNLGKEGDLMVMVTWKTEVLRRTRAARQ